METLDRTLHDIRGNYGRSYSLFIIYNLNAYDDVSVDNIGFYRDDSLMLVKKFY